MISIRDLEPAPMIGRRPRNAGGHGTMMLLAGVANLACAAQVSAEPSWPLPKAVASPPAIAAPRDVAYPGAIRLKVDTTDVARGIHRIHETVPVKGAQHLTLLYPQWIPGDPMPPNSLDQLAGLGIMARRE